MIASTKRSTQAKRMRSSGSPASAERSFVESAARRHIANYFRDVPVPEGFDVTEQKYVDMCVQSNICDAVDMAYESLRRKGILQAACGDGTIGEDVRFVVRLLKEIRLKCIPQEFSAGVMLMHLEIVEGLSF